MTSSDSHLPLMQHADQNMALMRFDCHHGFILSRTFLATYESNQANLRDGTRNQTGRAVGVKNSCALFPHQLHDIDWVLVGVQNPLGLSKQHKSPSPRMHCPASSTLAVWQTPFCPQVLMAPRCVSLWQQRHLQQQQQPEGEERRLAYITLPSITI